jgi:hypothetical protein
MIETRVNPGEEVIIAPGKGLGDSLQIGAAGDAELALY